MGVRKNTLNIFYCLKRVFDINFELNQQISTISTSINFGKNYTKNLKNIRLQLDTLFLRLLKQPSAIELIINQDFIGFAFKLRHSLIQIATQPLVIVE
ncbi:unnamed protein product [Paramecium octaurelia]|uniref:Uncharacterized protein n=1 Tax=Paramecium octaurelia TaxID=43137 RepID=A0A8S1TB02_PAROT|nr:unnamed protein product [Paramecium octaurelia]